MFSLSLAGCCRTLSYAAEANGGSLLVTSVAGGRELAACLLVLVSILMSSI